MIRVFCPLELYYNCSSPDFVLDTRVILPSKIHAGVSMSDWHHLGSHGPFKITFRRADWFRSLVRVRYWNIVNDRFCHKDRPPPPPNHYAIDQFGDTVSKEEYDLRYQIYLQEVGEGRMHKVWKTTLMFADEREWWTPYGIGFDISDVVRVSFMTNAPCVLSKIKRNRIIRHLKSHYPVLYNEIEVDDPYLRGEVHEHTNTSPV